MSTKHEFQHDLEERLRLVESVANTGFWEYDVESGVLIWDQKMFDIYGIEKSDFHGQFSDWEDRVHPEDVVNAKKEFEQSIATNGQFHYIFRIDHPKGVRHVRASATGLTDESGKVVRMIGVNKDFTAQIAPQIAVQQATDIYTSFINQNPSAIAMVDRDMRYLAASQKWKMDYGLGDREILGFSHYDIFPEIPERWKEIHRKCLAGEGQRCERDPFTRADGTIQYLRWNIQPWHHSDNSVGGMIMFTEDISGFVNSEMEAKNLQETLHETQSIARIGAWQYDVDTDKLHWDHVVRDIHGVDNDYIPVTDSAINFYKEGESREAINKAFADLLSKGSIFDLRLEIVTSRGNSVWIRTIGKPEYDVNGRIYRVSGLFQDIDTEKRYELERQAQYDKLQHMASRLSKQNASLMDFAHITSHNLRSPVGNLLSLSSMYNDFDIEDRPGLFEKIQGEINRLSSTLDDLVDSLVIREDANIDLEEIELRNIYSKIEQSLGNSISHTGISITTDFSECPSIRSNVNYMESIFLNMVTNAIKYRNENVESHLRIQSKIDQSKVVLSFEDNGIGIDLNRHGEKVFGLYKTFHRNKDAKGVGLFMVKAHVEALGGKINIQSETNKGTTFTITLPLQP